MYARTHTHTHTHQSMTWAAHYIIVKSQFNKSSVMLLLFPLYHQPMETDRTGQPEGGGRGEDVGMGQHTVHIESTLCTVATEVHFLLVLEHFKMTCYLGKLFKVYTQE